MPNSYTVRDRIHPPRTLNIWKPTSARLGILVKEMSEDGSVARRLGIFLTIPAARRLIAAMTQMCDEIERGG